MTRSSQCSERKVGRVTFRLVDEAEKPLHIRGDMEDGRRFGLYIMTGLLTRKETRVILGGIMGCMRAGITADNFEHGEVIELRRG